MGKRIAPWPDFAGNELREGDMIRHPSGETGIVVFAPKGGDISSEWLVDYADGTAGRLCLQVGDKGQAAKVDAEPQQGDGGGDE